MPTLTGMGRFFLQFGIVCFILSNIYIVVFNGFGFGVHPIMAQMSIVFPLIGLATIISGVIYIFGKLFIPSIAQAAAYSTYLTLFAGAVASIASIVASLLSLIPLPGFIPTAITGVISSIVGASMWYYIASRLAGLPPE